MTSNSFGHICGKSLHLHRMNDCDDLNLYYRKFLNKLSKICLKIFLPLLPLIYLLTLFLCRLLFYNQTKITFDTRTILYLICVLLTFMLLFLIRLHMKWKTLWFCTRCFLIFLLIIPLCLTYRTEQYHILFSAISITLIYSLLTFTLIQSVVICLSISILDITLQLHQKNEIHWKSFEFLSIVFFHFIINISGLCTYIRSITHIRQHFHAYETNLYEKNKYNVDCKKLNTIIGHCHQAQPFVGPISRLSNGINTSNQSNNLSRKFGTVINCNLSLNEQTRQHSCDELASLFDVLYCQIEQLILKQQSQAKYFFDNETIVIILLSDNVHEQANIDHGCRLAIELFRFIQHVNNVTQWCITSIIGIDYNELNVLTTDYIEGLAYDYSRWLREECLITNRIHVSSRIYDALKENKFYEFHSYAWLTNKNLLENSSTYFLFSTNMYEPQHNELTSISNSSMIDQLTRIQAQYHVEKHLGTITLTRSLRKRSLVELTTKHIHWFSLNFKEQYLTNDQSLQKDFQSTHRANRPTIFTYLFIIFILIASLCQAFVIQHIKLYYFILFPTIIIGLVLFIILFLYTMRYDQTQLKFDMNNNNRKFYVYFNILICLTLSTLFIVAIQYHSVQNFKYLFNSNEMINRTITDMLMDESSSQLNLTLNNTSIISESPSSSSFDRQYHDYLVLSPVYPFYLCSIYRQCSWMIKTFFIVSCLLVQLFLLEYIWLTTHMYFPSVDSLQHYTAFTLIIFHALLLIISSYVREWLEKVDFVWLKQVDNDRLNVVRQRDELIKQTALYFPLRVINYYLRTDSDLVLSQHYHTKYDRMALLYMKFTPLTTEHEFMLIDYLNDIQQLLRNSGKYIHIAMHRKSTIKEIMFSTDIDSNDSVKSIQQLVELLFELDERLKQLSPSTIHLTACLHIGCVHEILIHFENYPKIDLWSENIALLQLLVSKTQPNHCLTTAPIYHLLNDLYLFRTAGSIISAQINNTNIYYLLGRLIGDNVFQGRNALPLTIGHTNIGTVQKSSSTDDSHHSRLSQYHNKLDSQKEENPNQMSTTTTTTTTTSSSVVLNEQQSLLKQPSSSSRKHVRISNHFSPAENPSYRHTLLQALNATTNNNNNINNNNNNNHSQHQVSPVKRLSNRMVTKKHSSPPVLKDYVPRMVHLSDNSCWSSREAMTQSETSGSKCLILTQQMLNGSTDDNSRSKSTPPPPLSKSGSSKRHFSAERKSFTEEDFRQLLQEKSSTDTKKPARSLSVTNEETTSSYSGWGDMSPSPMPSVKSNHGNTQQKEPIKSIQPLPVVDCYYPRRPCDLAFTVNMTTEDDSSSRTDTKTTVINSPASTVVTLVSSPAQPPPSPPPSSQPPPTSALPPLPPVNTAKSTTTSSQLQIKKYRPAPFNLARKLIADTSESALSEISVEQQHEPWTQNIVYQSKHPQRTRLSSSYSNINDLLQMQNSSKFLPRRTLLPKTMNSDLLQRWLEDQLNLFRGQVKQTPPLSTKKTHRYSTNVALKTDSTEDESDTVSENTYTVLTNQSNSQSKSITPNKRPNNHVRYRALRKNSTQTSHLIRHESLKHRNRPLLFEDNPQLNKAFNNPRLHQVKKLPHRTDSSSMPRSDLSDLSSSRPDNLSESVISNLESEYDNIYTQPKHSNTTTIMSNSQILSDDNEDEITFVTAITTETAANRRYI